MQASDAYVIEEIGSEPLSVRLTEPFVIASARVDVTPNALVKVALRNVRTGALVRGLGEAATLHPVTSETQGEVLRALFAIRRGRAPDLDELVLPPCAAAGFDMAVCDAIARDVGLPVFRCWGSGPKVTGARSNMTIPIGDPAHMASLAVGWRAKGFTSFKVKVGKDADRDLRALEAIHRAVPEATFRLDANAGYGAREAIELVRAAMWLGLAIECFEQPCGRDDREGLAEVARAVPFDVVADESCRSTADVEALAAAGVDGVNLKLVKFGGYRQALAAGVRARELGLSIMVGTMVESRLGVSAAAHLACALGGVEYADLDTAWLLADDPFSGGYSADGADYTLSEAPGLGVSRAADVRPG